MPWSSGTHAYLSFKRNAWILAILVLAALLRLPRLYADAPAADLSRSGDLLADEGTWAVNALEWVLTGQWYIPDGYNPGVHSPAFMLFEAALLKAFGISLYTLRLGGIICSLISLYTLSLIVVLDRKRNSPVKESSFITLLPVVFAALAYPLVIFNRVAFLENLLICFSLWAAYSLLQYIHSNGKIQWLVSCWIALFAGYLTKPLIVFFCPVLFFMAWRYQPKRIGSFIRVSAGLTLFFAIALKIWANHFPQDTACFYAINALSRISLSPIQIVKNYAHHLGHLKLYEFMPVLYALALWMIGHVAHTPRRLLPPMLLLWSLWLAVGVIFLGFFSYSPPRYSLLLWPAVVGLAGYFFKDDVSANLPRPVYLPLFLIAACQGGFGLYRLLASAQHYMSVVFPWLGMAVMILLYAYFGKRNKSIKRALLAGILVLQLGQISGYYLHPRYSLFTAMERVRQEIDRDKRSGVIIAGDSAILMGLHAKTRAIDLTYCPEHIPRLINRVKPQYLFLENADEFVRLEQQMPEYWSRAQLVWSAPLMQNYRFNKDAVFYRIP
ncbi:MAG TPA: hypothetical protein PKI62_14295 [bacterium]|nr:hypothetical protein [bacterium]HPR89137.1 hypothetical protein [bacterium]